MSGPETMFTPEFMFSPGSLVLVRTCHLKEVEGEVIAFDYDKKVLMMKSPSSQHPNSYDVLVINLAYAADVKVKKEVKKEAATNHALPELHIQKIQDRLRKTVAERKALENAFKAGVSIDGINLYMSLTKTIGNTVAWDSQNIVVSRDVSIAPPYKADNCGPYSGRGGNDNKEGALKYVQQLVTRFWTEAKASSLERQSVPIEVTPATSSPTVAVAPVPPAVTEIKPASPAPSGGKGGKGQQSKSSPTGGGHASKLQKKQGQKNGPSGEK